MLLHGLGRRSGSRLLFSAAGLCTPDSLKNIRYRITIQVLSPPDSILSQNVPALSFSPYLHCLSFAQKGKIFFRPLKCFWFAKIFYRFSPFRSLGQSLTDRRVYMVFAHAGKNAQKNTGSSEKLPVK